MSVGGKIWQATAFVAVAGLLARVGSFLGNIVTIRFLGMTGVGELGLVESWLTIGMMFSLFGLTTAATRYLSHALEADRAKIARYVVVSCTLSLAFYLVVSLAAWGMLALAQRQSAQYIWTLLYSYRVVILLLLLVYTVRSMLTAVIYGLQAFRTLVGVNVLLGILAFPVSYLLVSTWGLEGALAARLLLTGIESLALAGMVLLLLRAYPLGGSWAEGRITARQLLSFALPSFVGQAVVTPIQAFAVNFLGVQPGGLAQVGLLTTANRLTGLANFLPSSLASTLTPILTAEWARQEGQHFLYSLTLTIRLAWLCSLLIVVPLVAAIPTLLTLLFGTEFVGASTVAIWMLVLMVLTSINETADRAFVATNRMWLSTLNNLGWAVIFLVGTLLVIPRSLALGYGGLLVVTFALYCLVQLLWLRKLFNLSLQPFFKLAITTVLLLLLAVASAELLSGVVQLGSTLLLTAATVLLIWHRLLTPTEQDALRRRIPQMVQALQQVRTKMRLGV